MSTTTTSPTNGDRRLAAFAHVAAMLLAFFEVSIFKTTSCDGFFLPVFEMMTTGFPVVISPYIPAAEIPIPC